MGKMFRSKGKKVRREWEKLLKEELNDV